MSAEIWDALNRDFIKLGHTVVELTRNINKVSAREMELHSRVVVLEQRLEVLIATQASVQGRT